MFEVHATIRYQQIEPIGIGEGMHSSVFRAFDPYLEREIAVKEIRKSDLGNDFNSFCQEARTMFATSDPNIVGVEYVCETPDRIAIALPYFSNGSLKARIKVNPLSLRELLKVAQGISAGLGRVHSYDYLHLDLRPANILFDDTEKPLIGDFGQSRHVSSNGAVNFPDTYKWAMPPEVWNTHAATVESDIYQLGVLLYRAANGESVYQAQKAAISSDSELRDKILKGQFPDPRVFLPHVPGRIRTIIRKAMRVEPLERYHSASEFAAALGRVPLPLDWMTNSLGGGAYKWRAVRTGRPELEVELSRNNTPGWQTVVWTARGGERRRRGVSEYWRKALGYKPACKHLTEVFADLNQHA